MGKRFGKALLLGAFALAANTNAFGQLYNMDLSNSEPIQEQSMSQQAPIESIISVIDLDRTTRLEPAMNSVLDNIDDDRRSTIGSDWKVVPPQEEFNPGEVLEKINVIEKEILSGPLDQKIIDKIQSLDKDLRQRTVAKTQDDTINKILDEFKPQKIEPFQPGEHIQESSAFPKLQKTIKDNITKIINHQFEQGYLTDKADIGVNIVKRELVRNPFSKNKNKTTMEADLSQNMAFRENGKCNIVLSFDDKGGVPYLGQDTTTQKITGLKNQQQKQYMQQFIALHEHYHCEFATNPTPIQMKGASAEEVAKVNYYLKDIHINIVDPRDDGTHGYMATLSENHSDVAAKMALIKQHGANNPDLLYALKAISTQREDGYLHRSYDTHFTHFALQELSKPENIDRLMKIDNPQDFKQMALEIANIGTEKVLLDKKTSSYAMFSETSLKDAVKTHVHQLIVEQSNGNQVSYNQWANNNQSSFVNDLAHRAMQGIDVKGRFEGNDENTLIKINELAKALTEKNWAGFKPEIEKFKAVSDQFVDHVKKEHGTKLGFEDPNHKINLTANIKMLQQKFLQDTRNLQPNFPKPK